MSLKLNSLVQATNDPDLLDYAFSNLGSGVSHHACFAPALSALRQKWVYHLAMQRTPMLLDAHERQMTVGLFHLSSIAVSIRNLRADDEATLRRKLKDQNRLLALLVLDEIGHRRAHLESDLIELLKDPDKTIREAAHRALVRVARGTDFGPIPCTSHAGISRSVEKWHHWLALQQGESPGTVARSDAVAAKPEKADADKSVNAILGHKSRELEAVPPEVALLRDELVKARDDVRADVLTRLRDAKGVEHTDALALAIPRLSAGAAQRLAREALAQRLSRMKAATLRDKMQEDDAEVRRAAALACGIKKADEHLPDLLQLLDDPEVAVIQAARQALRDLTGQDFGPTEEAGRRARADAAAAWHRWWQQRQGEQK